MADHHFNTPIGRFSAPDRLSRCKEVLEITETELRIVVCLIAAESCGVGLVTVASLTQVTGRHRQQSMADLARGGWVESPDKVTKSRERLWRATPAAWRRLGFVGWQVILFTKEALDAGLHLRALADEVYLQRLRLEALSQGGVIDVPIETVEGLLAPEVRHAG
jgi:hypothetical protein